MLRCAVATSALLRRAPAACRAAPRLLARPLSSTPAAAATAPIVDIKSEADFNTLVVQASAQPPPVGGPVIVDFYADWCGPCKQLTPRLEALVRAAGGAVRLAKIDVDALGELAGAMQVRSLPTVVLIHGGKLVDQFQGALPDPELKKWVDKAIALAGGPGGGEKALEAAAEALASGDVAEATRAYSEVLALPEHAASATAGLALCALEDDNLALAQELVAEIHSKHAGDADKPDVRKAISRVALAADAADGGGRGLSELRAAVAAAPADHAVRYELAQALIGSGDDAEAIDELLSIIKKERAWNEGAAKTLLLQVFDSLGSGHELVSSGRRRLANILLI